VQQRIGRLRAAPAEAPEGEYAFLVGRAIDAATLRRAEHMAREWAVLPHEVLIAQGWIDEREYVAALGATLGIDWFGRVSAGPRRTGEVMISAYAMRPQVIRERISLLPPGQHPVLATRREVDARHMAGAEMALIDHAIEGLWRANPTASARHGAETWQALVAAIVVGLFLGGAVVAPEAVVPFVMAILTLPFLCVTFLRSMAVVELFRLQRAKGGSSLRSVSDAELPRYSALVPLYREAEILPDLVAGMAALDYPSAKLEILLVLEASDTETRAALAGLDLPGNIRPVVVPEKGPRTKPKALNYALELVKSPYVVVYDAEDIPEPDQLRRALAAFADGGPEVACVQARLGIHNARQGWLARQFTIEYASLFDGQLPSLQRLGLPIPLGGTSNHFRVDRLKEVGGWDPYNVTEDADLGFRLARAGYRTRTIASTTWEEAPIALGSWVRQRTRWLKGWMQTYLVHTRRSARSRRALGWWPWLGLHVLIGGMLLSALVHPFVLFSIAWQALNGNLPAPSAEPWERALVWIGLANFALGYVSAMLAAAIAAWRRGWKRLSFEALLMPAYWLLISFASYRALAQLISAPHLWEKTAHGHSRAGKRAG
jgi:cellulose synthase/poly-beta-1,6-N-acetylglucosamine synthase-like glycosyltransferase